MSEPETVAQSHRGVPWGAVVPVAVRALPIAILVLLASVLLAIYTHTVVERIFDIQLLLILESPAVTSILTVVVFLLPIALAIAVSIISIRRCRFEATDDGLRITSGVFSARARTIPYDSFEEVAIKQSFIQSLYGSGTILLLNVTVDGEREREIRLGHVDNPELLYSRLLQEVARRVEQSKGEEAVRKNQTDADDPDAEMNVDQPNTPTDRPFCSSRHGDISRLASSQAAASAGFRYYLPYGIVHPDPRVAMLPGLFAGFLLSIPGWFILGLLALVIIPAFGLVVWQYLLIIGLGTVLFVGLSAAYWYWKHDQTQYEFYEDHVRFITGSDVSTVPLESVAEVEYKPADKQGALENSGTIRLRDDDGSLIETLWFVERPEPVVEFLENRIH